MSNKVEVVLLQSVKWLWNKDDIVSVAIPYAKNVLFAQGKAKQADKQALEAMKQKKEKQQKHEQEEKQLFEAVHTWSSEWISLKIIKKSTPQGHLYEKVSVKDIQAAIHEAAQLKIDSSWITIKWKIESIGEHQITIEYKGKKIQLPLTVQ